MFDYSKRPLEHALELQMPDWTYQTVFRRCLFAAGPHLGSRLALGSMGLLSRLPFGKRVIQLMGHMSPDPRLAVRKCNVEVRSPVGLGCSLDGQFLATPAFEEFGFGYLEVGPISAEGTDAIGAMRLDEKEETIQFDAPYSALSLKDAKARLARDGPFQIPLLARIEPSSKSEARRFVDELGECVRGFVFPIDRIDDVSDAVGHDDLSCRKRPIFLAIVDADAWRDSKKKQQCVTAIQQQWLQGIVVQAAPQSAAYTIGKSRATDALETVRIVRTELGPQPIIIGAAGVHSPADALDYLEAGADLVQVDSGLAFTGPGLPKRINEAVLYRDLAAQTNGDTFSARWGNESWFWAMLMGMSMFLGGVLAMAVATTRVVLPYDESMAGLTRDQLAEVNDRLLAFMMHDRVTLAGTMLAVGILYIALAWHGIRHGVHWAYVAVIASAFAGFFSFFSFLGFGYFDPFHAFVTAVLFQFLLLTIHANLPLRRQIQSPDLFNDRRWKANQWGQLLFVVHGAVLVVAGLVISWVGMTSVFVAEDLEFMHTTAEGLFEAHPRLVPLVAHDRATFGGMLISCGFATLLPALWGFGRGQAWLWWALMLAGSSAYMSTILVHWIVGYDSLKHLLPAYGGLAWLWAGGAASYGFMVARDDNLQSEWSRRLAAARSRS